MCIEARRNKDVFQAWLQPWDIFHVWTWFKLSYVRSRVGVYRQRITVPTIKKVPLPFLF